MIQKCKKILAIGLVAILMMALVACAENGYEPDSQDYYAANVAEETQIVANEEVVSYSIGQVIEPEAIEAQYTEYIEYEKEDTEENEIAITFENLAILGDMRALDMSAVVNFGLGAISTPPLTYEHMIEILESFIIAAMNDGAMPDVSYLLEEYSIQFNISISYDESSMAFSIGLPSERGGFVDIISIVTVDEIVYFGVAAYIELASEIIETVLDQLVASGMPPMEVSMIGIIARDILGRFDGTQYLAIDTGDFMDLSEFDSIMEQVEDWEELLITAFEAFEPMAMEFIETVVAEMDVVTMGNNWFAMEYDEQELKHLLEILIDIIFDNSQEVAEIINQVISHPITIDLLLMGEQIEEITADEIRAELGYLDLSFLDEVEGFFTLNMRADGGTLYEEVTMLISEGDDFTIRISLSGYSSVRTQPVLPPAASSVMTMRELFDDVLIDFTGMTYDDFLREYVQHF